MYAGIILKKIIFLLMFFFSDAYASFPIILNSSFDVVKLNPQVKLNEDIVNPPGMWLWIAELEFLNHDLNRFRSCLYYRVPFTSKKLKGILKLIHTTKACDQNYAADGPSYDNIKQVKLGEKNDLTIDGVVFNLVKKSDQQIAKRFAKASWAKQGLIPLVDEKKYFSLTSTEMTQNLVIKSGNLCHQVNEKCEEVSANLCHRCAEGFYEVLGNGCKKMANKYCGIDRCGQKNQPACLRGYQWSEEELSALCFHHNPVGFCQKGLSVTCNEKNEMICL